jgi:hypothetical protein
VKSILAINKLDLTEEDKRQERLNAKLVTYLVLKSRTPGCSRENTLCFIRIFENIYQSANTSPWKTVKNAIGKKGKTTFQVIYKHLLFNHGE